MAGPWKLLSIETIPAGGSVTTFSGLFLFTFSQSEMITPGDVSKRPRHEDCEDSVILSPGWHRGLGEQVTNPCSSTCDNVGHSSDTTVPRAEASSASHSPPHTLNMEQRFSQDL